MRESGTRKSDIEGSIYNPVEIIFANIAMEFSLIIRTVVTFSDLKMDAP